MQGLHIINCIGSRRAERLGNCISPLAVIKEI